MADQGNVVAATTEDPQQAEDESVRTQTIVWPASTFITTWTLGTGSDTTQSPGTVVVPAQDAGSASSQNVGAILSGVVVVLVLMLISWVCYRRSGPNGRSRKRSSRRNGSSCTSKGSSSSSGTSNVSSRNDSSIGSVASEMGEQWDQQTPVPGPPMPGMPLPVAGGWPPQHPENGMGQGMPPNMNMGFPPGHGGPPPMMGHGLPGRGGPPPMMGGGGSPPGGISVTNELPSLGHLMTQVII
ncbi:uncharacterized protein F4812DRAFT_458037 [Daldinia caldariorum]|uniref:uncharacterized protein n=1 Tax=Daldinia caldariorum TaxID=326644 RepID=UPI0020073727|nr:uncharacterized protein F4812DRAFT_458037 [Daldinia caldariorum]KAI1469500.1 hypothetical protein F4812DRAFT_458037 [Daldinia caldariorum]